MAERCIISNAVDSSKILGRTKLIVLTGFDAMNMGTDENVIFILEIVQCAELSTYLYTDCPTVFPLSSITESTTNKRNIFC